MAGKDITLYEESTSTNLFPRTYTRNVFDEDGTTTLNTLLQNLKDEAGKIAEVKVNGTALTITNKSVNIDLSSYAKTSSLSSYLPLNGGTINAGRTITFGGTTNATGANLKWSTVNAKNPFIGYATDQIDGTFVWSLTGTNYASGLAIGGGSGNLLWKGNKVATTSDIPDTSGFAKTTDLANYVPTSRTVNGKALSSNISLGNKDVGALPDYTLTISHQSAGNPRMVKFASVNYASVATCFKMAAMTCHDNGVSYQFLTDMLIAVTTAGEVTANIYKFAQSSVGNVDGVARYTGDVFYVNNTTNKIVDFYILCGQYSSSQFTPVTKVGSTNIAYVTQYSGNATYYSSGTKEWVNGCGTTYARTSDTQKLVTLTQAEYDALTPVENTIYFVEED